MSRKVEVFTAGCGVCDDLVSLVHSLACSSCDVTLHDMKDPTVMERAKSLGVHSVPAVAVDGRLVARNAGGAFDDATLRLAGVGVATDAAD